MSINPALAEMILGAMQLEAQNKNAEAERAYRDKMALREMALAEKNYALQQQNMEYGNNLNSRQLAMQEEMNAANLRNSEEDRRLQNLMAYMQLDANNYNKEKQYKLEDLQRQQSIQGLSNNERDIELFDKFQGFSNRLEDEFKPSFFEDAIDKAVDWGGSILGTGGAISTGLTMFDSYRNRGKDAASGTTKSNKRNTRSRKDDPLTRYNNSEQRYKKLDKSLLATNNRIKSLKSELSKEKLALSSYDGMEHADHLTSKHKQRIREIEGELNGTKATKTKKAKTGLLKLSEGQKAARDKLYENQKAYRQGEYSKNNPAKRIRNPNALTKSEYRIAKFRNKGTNVYNHAKKSANKVLASLKTGGRLGAKALGPAAMIAGVGLEIVDHYWDSSSEKKQALTYRVSDLMNSLAEGTVSKSDLQHKDFDILKEESPEMWQELNGLVDQVIDSRKTAFDQQRGFYESLDMGRYNNDNINSLLQSVLLNE